MEGIPRKGRHRPAFRDLAEEHGYTPGKFTMRRMAEAGKMLDAAFEKYSLGVMTGHEKDTFFREAAEFCRDEAKYLDYFYPKMRSSEDSVQVEGSLTVNIKRYSDADGD